ncbi:18S rRNA biogenesis protein [Laetiporus sulphureus 93-53]|uniref:18S rRNA biogenesis protein n=1 Tax=Laetiporus sulphureus 93-53 TaxID=1314785 RepID=A0A165FX91_9APHY|nr:18S rRNA biogenesis protein [Laetiporus sulphureus 93-53]KZT09534.1 18S rRNA biogenesis protein [Laetiporus sulphureus 93-53]
MVAEAIAQTTSVLNFSGHQHLRHRLVLSILSGKPVKVDKIRPEDKNPGLRDYEVSLLRLLERVTNGTVIEISVTGTAILVKPGIIEGGPVTHDCPLSRSVGYFLEPIIMLAPFSKKPFQVTLRGITSDDMDLSVDLIRTVTLPYLQLFGISDGLELRIKKRGSPPLGGGEVQFLCPLVKQVKTLNFVERGKIKRIRGISHAVRVNPQFSNRMIEAARSVLNRYIPDIYIYSDVYKGEDSGKSPGYGLSLLSETTTGAIHCAEAMSKPGVAPEDIALLASRALLSEVHRGGCVDSNHQVLVLLMMVLGSEDVGRCRMGEPTERTIQFLRDVKTCFGTTFKIIPADPADPECSDYMFSCYGTGYMNANRTLS